MIGGLTAMMALLLARAQVVMTAASAACRLFVFSVMPGLLPYMILALMLVSRVRAMNPALLVLLGFGGGSPTGGRLLKLCPALSERQRVRLAVTCSTMSPMFLLGTLGGWLKSPAAGVCILVAVLAGGLAAGALAGAGLLPRKEPSRRGRTTAMETEAEAPLSLGAAVEQASRTMLLVCGTMVMLRVFADLASDMTAALCPALTLPVTTLLEVTTGVERMASLPLPLALRTALMAGATGFGGMAVMMQNRAVWPEEMLSLGEQALWQAVHGAVSFLIALGLMLLLG